MEQLNKIFGGIRNVVIVILILILILKACGEAVPTQTTTRTETVVKWDTIYKSIPTYVPKYHTKILFVPDSDTFWRDVDTNEILIDYFSSYVYFDTIKNDSITITINDTISKNKIKNRKVDYFYKYPTIYTTTTITEYINKRELYYGFGLGATTQNLNYIGAEILLKTKRNTAYGIGLGVNQTFNPVINGRIYWKLGKK